MCDRKLPQRKKRGRQQAIDPPFPVPIATITHVAADKKNWYYFTGEFDGDQVVVKHSGDIHFLYRMGFFGRGLMSQGMPNFYDRLPNVFIPEGNQDLLCYKVARRRMFLRHNQWKMSHDHGLTNEEAVNADENKEYDSDIEYVYGGTNMEDSEVNKPTNFRDKQGNQSQYEVSQLLQEGDDIIGNVQLGQGQSDTWTDSPEADYFWGTLQSEKTHLVSGRSERTGSAADTKTLASWDADNEGDTDFWGCAESNQTSDTVAGMEFETSAENNFTHASDNIDLSANKSNQSKTLPTLNRTRNQTHNSSTIVNGGNLQFGNSSPIDQKGYGSYTKSEVVRNQCCDEVSKVQDETSVDAKLEKTKSCVYSTREVHVHRNITSQECDSFKDHKVDSHGCSACEDVNDVNLVTKSGDHNIEGRAIDLEFKDRNTDKIFDKGDGNAPLICTSIKDPIEIAENKPVSELNSEQTILKSNSREGDPRITSESFTQELTWQNASINNTAVESTDKNIVSASIVEKMESNSEPHSPADTLSKVHVHCETEDIDGDYLVIDDSDCETERGLEPVQQPNVLWKPVLKKDPFPIQEPLVLTLEEAFFLSYGLGCLTVQDENREPFTLCDLWQRCVMAKQRFLPSYVAYHYFRSKGWVPKPGLLFGVDFILYKVGPPFYHGSYSVIVKTVYEGTLTEVEKYTDRKFSWTTFSGLNRVTEHVAKVLMICYVIFPNDLNDEQTQSPDCISQFKIKLQVINRWVSSQERGKETEEMP